MHWALKWYTIHMLRSARVIRVGGKSWFKDARTWVRIYPLAA